MKIPTGILLLLLCGATATQPTESNWNGFNRRDFVVDGRACILVLPKTSLAGHPWIWRTEFFGNEPQADISLLGYGFALAYMDIRDMYGAPVALDHMDKFYDYLTQHEGLSAKTVLEGFSRGGLSALNWAARHPDRVACIYVDAPVCDFKSWPMGQGTATRSDDDVAKLLKAYGMTEQQALEYRLNPVDNLKPLAAAKIPIICVYGRKDKTVPFDENASVIEQRYRALGGQISMFEKPFGDHHPHSLANPGPIVNFILAHGAGQSVPYIRVPGTPYGYDYFVQRSPLTNSLYRFEHDRVGTVVFLGGSITNMKGWRDLVCQDLRRRFPITKFNFINAGIPSYGSTPDAFRFGRDVLSHEPVDLLFVDAAVNDSVNGASSQESLRGIEGIIRQARVDNPMTDIVILEFAALPMMEDLHQGIVPDVIANQERVAQYYDVSSIDLNREVAERIAKGEFAWATSFKSMHAAPFGQQLYAATIGRLLDAAWNAPAPAYQTAHSIPDQPLDQHSYFRAKLVDLSAAQPGTGWMLQKDWVPSDRAVTRAGFVHVPALVASQPPAVLKFPFAGTGVGIFCLSGPGAGMLWYSIDGAPAREANLYTQWSGNLYLNWSVMFEADLSPGKHELELIVSKDSDPRSADHQTIITDFLVNGS